MATCIRDGVQHKRHQYTNAITEVDGTTLSQVVCKACGKVQVGSIIKFEKELDNGIEVL
jgi:hypothetical protein